MIQSDEYLGGDFVILPAAGKSVLAKDVAKNYVWLRPIVECIRDKVPSNHFLADVFRP